MHFQKYILKNKIKCINIIVLCFISLSINSQTIPSTGSSVSTCGDCTPTGWLDNNGTPDISNRNNAGGQGSTGGGATWQNAPLPLPPTGDQTWISLRDVGTGGTEESVKTTIGDLEVGRFYIVTVYAMTSLTNSDGEAAGGVNQPYAGTYMNAFDYQIDANPRQVISNISRDTWKISKSFFIGTPDVDGNVELTFYPRTDSDVDGTIGTLPLVETVNIAIELNAVDEVDTDNDGIPDTIDIDDDNDGILDTDELTISGTTYDPLGDEDGDILPNYLDTRDDGTGDASTTNYSDINGDGVADIFDFDLDGIPNHLDLDADNDGIPDIIEGQPTATYITPTGIVGANGLDSAFENNDTPSATSYTIINTDSGADSIPDYLDLDSDNDGTSDETEANSFLTDEVGVNGLDNAYDNGDNYTDTNGSFDNSQTDNFPDTTPGGDVNWRDNATTSDKDTDGDGIIDSVDVDDDNDGIPDVNECTTSTTAASNASGVQSETSITNSGNAITSNNAYAILNDKSDFLSIDLNSDTDVANNTIIFIESSVTTNITHRMKVEQSTDNINFTNQKIYTWTSINTDEEKQYKLNAIARYIRISLEEEDGGNLQIDNVSFEGFTITCDADGDGIPNQLDLDSDNDGIPDNVEAQTTAGYVSPASIGDVDTDNDGLNDAYDPDCTPCGAITGVDLSTPNNHDTIDEPDYLDTDSDNDGTPDRIEANLFTNAIYGANGLDSNYEVSDNYTDVNGTFDETPYNDFPDNPSGGQIDWRDDTSIFTDNDNDGVPDSTDLDDDNDGILDFEESGFDPSADSDADNIPNYKDADFSTGVPGDTINGFGIWSSLDPDIDGVPNHFDLDADNDGIPDNIEAQTTASYVTPDGVFDANGVDTAYTGGLSPVDTDTDSENDYLELDSDNDGILDNTEAGLSLTGVYGVNGLDNAYDNGDNYIDVNGSFDNSQTNNFPDVDSDVFNGGDVDYRDDTFTKDTDGDGVNDEVDLDDDNDGILDTLEQGNCDTNNTSLNWSLEYGGLGEDPLDVGTTTVSTVDIKLTRTTTVASDSDYEIANTAVSNNTDAYIFTQRSAINAVSRHTFNFDVPVKNLGFTIYDIDEDNGNSRDKVEIIITKQDGSNYTLLPADYNLGATSITNTATNTFENVLASGDDNEDLIITSIPVYITQLQIKYSNTGSGSITLNQNLAIGDFSFCAPLDSDNDGVFDFRDLDSDNDGIPDNIEAQTTNGYVAPTGSFSLTGIDLAYHSGLTPINSDGDADADYLDLDSDGDGINDINEGIINEALPTNSSGRFTGTVGLNGLVDVLEASDTDQGYTDINGIHVEPKTDGFLDDSSDSDVNSGGNLDYRDTVTGLDTDNDGIANNIDIDDDNDGIPDVLENTPGLPAPDAIYSFENNTNDSSGNDFEQQNAIVPAYNSDNVLGANAIEFDGTFLIQYSDGTFLNQAITTLTHSVWIKPDDLTGVQEIIDEGGNTNGITVRLNGNTLEAAVREGSVSAPTTSLTFPSDGNWHHVAITYNNGDLTLFLDGVASTTISSGFGELAAHSDGSGLGGRNNDDAFANATNGDYFDGLMDEYYHYPVALTPAQIAVLADLDNPIDTDGDGIINSLDIDSDNDGIPDNVEAQTTLGYISPSGIGNGITDNNNNGLDDNYETAEGGTNIVPINNDSADEPDYLDTDSDNDGIFDISENNVSNSDDAILDSNTGTTTDGVSDGIVDPSNFTDTDGDGLADIFEGSDINDEFDVNDEINAPATNLPDTDSDVATEDVDFRDDTADVVLPGVAGNILWLRADKDVTGTSNVTSWIDQTASAFDATSDTGTSPSKIDVGLNFNPVLDFDPASNQDLIITDGILGNDTYSNLWSYVVVNPNSVSANGFVFIENVNGTGNFHNRTVGGTNFRYRFGSPTDHFLDITANENSYNLYTFGATTNAAAAPTGNTQAIHILGNSLLPGTTPLVNVVGTNDDFDIGSNGTANFWDGQIAEIMIFNETPTALKQQQVESYLAIKYGFTLSTISYSASIVEGDYILQDQSTKVWDYTANTTGTNFHNNVAGIGRDDAMALNQKQSKSSNTPYNAITNPAGPIITIGLNAIEADNISNVNIFSSNKDFLMWGNNTGVINTVTETELICAPEKTIGRTWKIIENGSVNSVQVAANKDAIDGALTTANTVKVLKVADNETFTTNVNYVPLTEITINGEDVYAANFDFNGTKFFTYSEINGIFWNGDMGISGSWSGGNSIAVTNGPSTNVADRDKVMVIDAQTSLTHAILAENVEVECVWIKANSKLMVSDDRYLEFDEDFILDGEIRLIGDGQLIQTHIGLSNVQGNGKLYRDQQAVVPNVFRYHYWSSPVRELGLDTYRVGEVMKDGNTPTSASSTITDINWVSLDQPGIDNRGLNGATGSPITIANYWLYTNQNDAAADDERSSNYVRKLETGAIKRGLGYTMKSTGQNPQNFTFVGSPNDGSITIPVIGNTATLVGNPYPSALDATDFLNTNLDAIEGTLYFWEHTGEDTEPSGISGHTFAGYYGGYSQRNLVMGIAANGVPTEDPLEFTWQTATDNGTDVTETVEDIEVTVELSDNTINIDSNVAGIGATTANIITKLESGTDTYDVTFTFDNKVDVTSIFLYNNAPSAPISDPTLTLTPDNGQTPVIQTLTGASGQEIMLNWIDVTTFTITTNRPYNLVIDNLKFVDNGNLPSLGDGTYHAPNRYIAVAQGFFVRADTDGGLVRFENSQRNYEDDDFATGGTFFFKSEKQKKSKRKTQEKIDLLPVLKLGFNRTTEDLVELHRQIGISFRRGNTYKFDNGYDSEIFDVGANDIFWQFPQLENRKLVIAGIGEITNNMEVPLAINVSNTNTKSIQIDEVRNLDREIFLLDKVTDTYYELSKEPTEITIPVGNYTDRFFITFSKQKTLNTETINPLERELSVFADAKNDEIVIQNSKLLKIKKVELFNLLGQKVRSFSNIDTFTENRLKVNNLSAAIYIVNIETEKGRLSKKIIIE